MREVYTNGRFKGYCRSYAANCDHANGKGIKCKQRGHQGMDHPKAKPMFSIRYHDTGQGIYRQIKNSETGRWIYEHRHIMELHIWRKLEKHEIIHHRNEKKLDNSIDNLEIISHADHMRHHNRISTWSRLYSACIVCGETSRKHASKGKCSRCNQLTAL